MWHAWTDVSGAFNCQDGGAPTMRSHQSVGHESHAQALVNAMRHLIARGIVDDRRRQDVATSQSGYAPRVQLGVFEYELRSRREATALRAKLRTSSTRPGSSTHLLARRKIVRAVVVLGNR